MVPSEPEPQHFWLLIYHLAAAGGISMDRRRFLASSAAVLASGAAAADSQPPACADRPPPHLPVYPQQQQYRISYTTNTRGGWEGDPFKGMREGREVGFRYMEIFGTSFMVRIG